MSTAVGTLNVPSGLSYDHSHRGRDILLSIRLLKKFTFIMPITRARVWRSNCLAAPSTKGSVS